ncbi:serine-type endopeptidase isoform 1 [Galdieria sulphuraria]|uniref:Serine-type endopeptidase isoform 1 n=1 Tax=Galdieria sulphuraria TaxID=130081 RepID=M2XVU2_GALSU|nr:serine-type endopeptidase isoform 1 [Galdieria sulphuraria]EME27544.1 serine-type endopeptidase isoform 1 [Galdieria sulphuraria]|eukprot:XP_005704064.1 serine-type endopeptidase isoform 1 [Galdieria sulphuraria]
MTESELSFILVILIFPTCCSDVRRKSRERKSGNTDLDEELLYHSSSPDQTSRISGGVNRRSKMDRSHSKLGNSNLCLQDEVEVEDYMHDDNVKDVEMSAGFPADVLDSVFKLYVTHCEPNYSLPWQKRRQTYSTSTAFAVGNRRILTNAHCVEHSTVVKIKKRGSEKKYMAQVVSIGNDCDIALLSVEDESFWEGVECLSSGRLPYLQEAVTVVGYPIGGENISVTAGVVSRVELQQYSHGAIDLLGVQIDAAINPGNSGGPAFNSRFECVGIAFQSLLTTEAENIGYIIPWLVVQHFLDDFDRNGYYTGFCYCGFEFQRMENEYLRKSFHLSDESGGVLIKRIAPTSPCSKVLQKGDVITHFDGVPIANDGTVSYRGGERINFHYLITLKFVGESCTVRIVRNGNIMEVSYPLFELPLLVPIHEKRPVPEYLTVAGLVFVALSEPYLRSEYGEKWDFEAPVKLLDKLLYGYKRTANEQVVILSQVLNARINVGYECLTNTELLHFNGTRVENLCHLANLIDETSEEFLRFDLEFDEVIVIEKQAALEQSSQILVQHGIPTPRSLSHSI